jgi:alkylation response protein AidB-like acyl-CoA dehydrogenase
MDFSLIEMTPELQQFAKEVRAFLDELLTQDVYDRELEGGEGFDEKVHLALGERGWLMPSWRVEHGGAGLDATSARILELEMSRRHVPGLTTTISTTNLVWAAVERYLDPVLMDPMRLDVARGKVRLCLGYTEPDGGSDIAAAKVRAVQDGEEWLINGSKIFTTCAQNCQYVFLITRTDPTLPKHKGLTMFLVPLDSPGIEIQGIRAFSGERTNIVYYSDVRVSDQFRLGPVNAGWSVLHGPLDAEHGLGPGDAGLRPGPGAMFLRHLEDALEATLYWAQTAVRVDGSRVAEDRVVQLRIGRVIADYEAGVSTPGPMGRVAGADVMVRGSADLVDLVGIDALESMTSLNDPGLAAVEYAHRFAQGTTTYGGTVEVFRNIIAQHDLGLPTLALPGRRAFLPAGH